jgi:hypothetical protein
LGKRAIKESHVVIIFIIVLLFVLDIDLAANWLYRKADNSELSTPGDSAGTSPGALSDKSIGTQPSAAVSTIEVINFSNKSATVEIYDSQKKQIAKFSLAATHAESKTTSVSKGNFEVRMTKESGETVTKNVTITNKTDEVVILK